MSTDVVMTQEKHIGVVTLNRPQALHALTLPMVRSLQQQLFQWQDDPLIHAVVIRASEGKAFCAGGDVRWLYETGLRASPEQLSFFQEEYALNKIIHHYPKPYIALMDGITMGGGVGVSLHGFHPVASHAFVFAMPETSIGFFPDIGASFLLSRLPGAMGAYLGLTGNRLGAEAACALGLVRHVVPASSFEQVLNALVHTDLSNDASARVTACLAEFSDGVNQESITSLQSNVDACFMHPDVPSIFSSLGSMDEEWHRDTLKILTQKSPLSLSITLTQLFKAKQMNFDACMQMDDGLVRHFMKGNDFYEGVRALLVDKDKSPQWNPSQLSQVTPGMIAAYFDG